MAERKPILGIDCTTDSDVMVYGYVEDGVLYIEGTVVMDHEDG